MQEEIVAWLGALEADFAISVLQEEPHILEVS